MVNGMEYAIKNLAPQGDKFIVVRSHNYLSLIFCP